MKIKKYFVLFLGLSFGASSLMAQNRLLDKDFWQSKPNLEAVKAEIAKGNNPTEANNFGFDAATQAILADEPLDVVTYLVELPGNGVAKLTHDSRIYLHWAGYRKNLPLAKWLIDKGSSLSLKDSHGYTPISFAAFTGLTDPQYYDLFFQKGIDPNETYQDGAKLINFAIANDSPELKLMKYFVSKGANPKAKDDLGRTLTDYAAKGQNLDLLKSLIKHGIGYTGNALFMAAKGTKEGKQALPVFDFLVNELKISPKITDHEGNNMLHLLLSGRFANNDAIAYFIGKGVSPEQMNDKGETPLMKAVGRNNEFAVEAMLDKGIKNINAADKKGISALCYAMENASPKIAELLISKAADAAVKDKKGNNLLYYAIKSYSGRNRNSVEDILKKIDLLKAKGMDISAPQADGNTILHLAVGTQNPKLIEALKPYIKNINAKNEEGLTPLHMAAMVGQDAKIINLLLKMGADKSIKTSLDETAYDLAEENEILSKNINEIEPLRLK